jgi:hypothetical protein
MDEEATNTAPTEQVVKGRSVFLVETTPAGIAVQTALLTEDGKLLSAPAIFPDVEYAFTQVDELKRLISAHFSQAALLGAQVAAQQATVNAASTDTSIEAVTPASAQTPAAHATDETWTEAAANGSRKTLENLKKFVSSGLAQVSKIAQPSSTATPAPENTPHIETIADAAGGGTTRKTRGSSKKTKADDGTDVN